MLQRRTPLTLAAVLLLHAAVLAWLAGTRPQAVAAQPPAVVVQLQAVETQPAQGARPAAAPAPSPEPARREPPRKTSTPARPQVHSTPSPRPAERTPHATSAPATAPATTARQTSEATAPDAAGTAGKALPHANAGDSADANTDERHEAPAMELPSTRASYLHNPRPPYPASSKRLNETGTVLLRVRVGADGSAENVSLQKSSGYPALDDSALHTVERWRFVPGKRHGVPTAMDYTVPVRFQLD